MAGKKGRSGRKSLQYEKRILERLLKAFDEGIKMEDMEAVVTALKNKKGVLNLTNLAVHKAVENEEILMKLLDKVAPTKNVNQNENENTNIFKPITVKIKK